jgi:protein-disulfide isomerase
MKNLKLLAITLVVTVVLIVLVAAVFSKGSPTKTVDQNVLMNNIHLAKGPEKAKVTVIEFGDLQCPACGSAEPVVEQLLKNHPDVRFVFRQFPVITVHPNAQISAQFVEAAASMNLDSFWKLHDYLYANQADWSELSSADVLKKFGEYTDKLQIDKTELLKRIDSQAVKDSIATDVSDANKLGVAGTPTFYVNGQEALAPQLESAVQSALAK